MKTVPDDAHLEPGKPYDTAAFSASSLERIDVVCMRFESVWKTGEVPNIESHLKGFDGELRSALFTELLLLDIDYRTRNGQTPDPSDYETRFPGETPAIECAFRNTSDSCQREDGDPETDPILSDMSITLTSELKLSNFHAQGGLGVVYAADDVNLGRRVAVKFPRKRSTGTSEQLRLAREAEITSRLEHPGIVSVYARGFTDDGRPCYVMPLIDGQTLQVAIGEFHSSIARKQVAYPFGGLDFRQLLQRFVAVCSTVAYAHDQLVIHRDIKPGNIMLGRFGETYLLDWGLAKSLDSSRKDHKVDSDSDAVPTTSKTGHASQTKTGQQLGTPAFASPEQAMGRIHEHDFRSDVFALGATLYYLLVGKGPVEPEQLNGDALLQCYHNIPNPRSIDRKIPRELDSICCKAIAFDPELRYQTAELLGGDLEKYLADETTSVVIEPWTVHFRRWIRKNPWRVVALASSLMVGLISLGVGSWLLSQKNLALTEINKRLLESRQSEQIARANTKQALRSLTDSAIAKWLASGVKLTPSDEQFLQSILSQYQAFADAESQDDEAAETKSEGYYRVAQLHKILGNRDQAIATCLSGLEFIESLESLPSDKLLQIESTVQSFCGTMLSEIGRWEQAKSLSQLAVETAQVLTLRNPENPAGFLNFSQRLTGLGKIHMRCREFNRAAALFKQSLEILEGFPIEQQEELGWRKQAATLYQVLGLALENLDRPEEAVGFLVRSVDFYDEYAANSTSIEEKISHFRTRATLAAIQSSLGQNAASAANLNKALSQAETFIAEFPLLTAPLIDIGNIWFQKSGACFNDRQFRQSIEHGEKAIQSFETLLDRSPDDLFCMNCLSSAYGLQAGSYSGLDEMEPALENSLIALGFARKLYDAHPDGYRNELITRLFFASNIHRKHDRYAEVREFASQALSLVNEVQDSKVQAEYFERKVCFHEHLASSLMFFDLNQQAIEQWQSIIDMTQVKPLVDYFGEDMQLLARIEIANCQAAIEPEVAVAKIEELSKQDELKPAQVYKLTCAAAEASRNLEDLDRKAVAETMALQLLQRVADLKYFTSESQFDKLVRQNASFGSLLHHEKFFQIEQPIVGLIDDE